MPEWSGIFRNIPSAKLGPPNGTEQSGGASAPAVPRQRNGNIPYRRSVPHSGVLNVE